MHWLQLQEWGAVDAEVVEDEAVVAATNSLASCNFLASLLHNTHREKNHQVLYYRNKQ